MSTIRNRDSIACPRSKDLRLIAARFGKKIRAVRQVSEGPPVFVVRALRRGTRFVRIS